MKRLFSLTLLISLSVGVIAPSCDDDSNNENNTSNVNNTNNNTSNVNNVNNGDCGNGLIDEGESCDGTNLNDRTCEMVSDNFIGGTLKCSAACTWDVSSCTTEAGECGDGIIAGLEVCDGTNLGTATCTSLGLGFTGGTLACSSTCISYDTALCVAETSECGNGIIEEFEACDETNLGGVTCESLGFAGGTLGCRSDCQFDASQCVSPGCGDGIIAGLETCEGSDLGGNTCTTIGQNFAGGTLACNSVCQFDTSLCETCGNGATDSGEVCDGIELQGETCESLGMGFVGGTLGCLSDCSDYDTSLCIEPVCGDGAINGTDTCDGTDLDGNDCTTIGMGFVGGTLTCLSDCTNFDTSSCDLPPCGDGLVEGLETCDGTNLNGNDCTTIGMGFVGGTLLCNTSCTDFDSSSCTN